MSAAHPERLAIAAVGVLVVLAVGIGLVAAPRAPIATPTPAPTSPPPPTPTPDTGPLVFEQPLSAGCATDESVWVFSDGGGIGRYDGERWELVDPVLRSVVAAHCMPQVALGVGPGATLVRADDDARTIVGDILGDEHLYGIGESAFGVAIVGGRGTAFVLTANGWQRFARGIPEDLRAVSRGTDPWMVGEGGAAYRLEHGQWIAHPVGVDVTLRAVARPRGAVLVAGDGGALLRFEEGEWRALETGTDATLNALLPVGEIVWVAGDRGTLLRVLGDEAAARDLGTTCDLRALFERDGEIWAVGSAPGRAGVWRGVDGPDDRLERWGTC